MVSIIIGCFISFFIGALFAADDYEEVGASVCVIGIFASIIVVFFVPIGGYKDWNVYKERELVLLPDDVANSNDVSNYYISLSSDGIYTYKYKVDDSSNDKSDDDPYKVATLSNNDKKITVIEQKDCDKPVLIIYRKETAFDFIFTFAPDKYSYSFVVPEGSINKYVKQ